MGFRNILPGRQRCLSSRIRNEPTPLQRASRFLTRSSFGMTGLRGLQGRSVPRTGYGARMTIAPGTSIRCRACVFRRQCRSKEAPVSGWGGRGRRGGRAGSFAHGGHAEPRRGASRMSGSTDDATGGRTLLPCGGLRRMPAPSPPGQNPGPPDRVGKAPGSHGGRRRADSGFSRWRIRPPATGKGETDAIGCARGRAPA